MCVSLKDFHAKAMSKRPQSGLKAASRPPSTIAKMYMPPKDSHQKSASKRPQTGLKAASKPRTTSKHNRKQCVFRFKIFMLNQFQSCLKMALRRPGTVAKMYMPPQGSSKVNFQAASIRPQSGLKEFEWPNGKASQHNRKMCISLEDFQALATSRRPQSGHKGGA